MTLPPHWSLGLERPPLVQLRFDRTPPTANAVMRWRHEQLSRVKREWEKVVLAAYEKAQFPAPGQADPELLKPKSRRVAQWFWLAPRHQWPDYPNALMPLDKLIIDQMRTRIKKKVDGVMTTVSGALPLIVDDDPDHLRWELSFAVNPEGKMKRGLILLLWDEPDYWGALKHYGPQLFTL